MNTIEVTDWVSSAIIIDDQWEQVEKLDEQLNLNGVSTLYIDPVTDPEVNFLKNIDLIFLDIDYGNGGSPKNQASFAVNFVMDVLNSNCSPYGVVVWSREPDLEHVDDDGAPSSIIDSLKKYFYDKAFDKPKPLFVIDLEKSSWLDKDISPLFDTLKEKLNDHKMAQFFSTWKKEVLSASAKTYSDMRELAEEIKDEPTLDDVDASYFELLKYATYTHYGFPRGDGDDLEKILARYSFCYISSVLHDNLNSQFSKQDLNDVFEDSKDSIREQLSTHGVQIQECHNTLCRILKQNKVGLDKDAEKALKGAVGDVASLYNETSIHSVLARLNFRALYDVVQDDILDLPGVIYSKEFKNKGEVVINITPPCDVAQGKKDAGLFLTGKLHTYTTYSNALTSFYRKDGERYFKTPPALFEDGKFAVFYFDLRDIVREIDNKECKAGYMLKDSVFADLMQNFGQHNSRLGTRSF